MAEIQGVPAYPKLAEEYGALRRDVIDPISLHTVDVIRNTPAEMNVHSAQALALITGLGADPIYAAAHLMRLAGASDVELSRWQTECRQGKYALGNTIFQNDTSIEAIETEVVASARRIGVQVGQLHLLPQAYFTAESREQILAALGVSDRDFSQATAQTVIPGLSVQIQEPPIKMGKPSFYVNLSFNDDPRAIVHARRAALSELKSYSGTMKF